MICQQVVGAERPAGASIGRRRGLGSYREQVRRVSSACHTASSGDSGHARSPASVVMRFTCSFFVSHGSIRTPADLQSHGSTPASSGIPHLMHCPELWIRVS